MGRSDWGDRNDKSGGGAKVTDGQFGTIEVTAAATACLPPCTECSCRSELIHITLGKEKLRGGRKSEVEAEFKEGERLQV